MREIPGLEGMYAATYDGRIFSLPRPRSITPRYMKTFDKNGYRCVGIRPYIGGRVQRTLRVHRLVAMAYIPNPLNLPQVNHKDGNKSNNCVDNLEWSNHSLNAKHAWATGLNVMTPKRLDSLKLGRYA